MYLLKIYLVFVGSVALRYISAFRLSNCYLKTIQEYIPQISDQVIVLVTDFQRESATASMLRERTGMSQLLKQHATQENLLKHHLASVSLGGREYDFVSPSTTGYE